MAKNSFSDYQDISLLDYDPVIEHIRAIAKTEETFDADNVKDLSKSLSLFFLQSYFPDLDSSDALDCIVDGSNDQGFDAIYIEEKPDGENIVNIIQTKLVTTRDKVLDKRFPANELTKLVQKFDSYIVNNKYHENANEKLRLKLNEVFGLERKTYNIILVTTGIAPAQASTDEFFDDLNKYNARRKYVDATFIGLGDLVNLLPDVAEKKIDIKIRFEGHVIEGRAGRVQNVLIGRVLGRQIAELVRENGMELFAKNVRGYLRTKNPVNTDILKTATSSEEAPYFFVLNNGITIVCDDLDYMSGRQSPEVEVKSAQIVNGGQTSNTLFEALKADKLDQNVEVLVRLIETGDEKVVDRVTKATNHQTSVRTRDLRSNDPIQKKIEQYLKDKHGYYYESRKNKYQGLKSVKIRMDMETATQSYFAYDGDPVFAKNSKSKLFDDEAYDLVFNDSMDIERFFFVYRLRKALEAMRNIFSAKYGFVRDAEITSLSLFKLVAPEIYSLETLTNAESSKILEKIYGQILSATQVIVAYRTFRGAI